MGQGYTKEIITPDATTTNKGIASFDEDSFAITSGDVKPQFIGFHAFLNTATTYASGAKIVCNSEDFDIGSNYNTSTGLFTAPVAGYYFLYAQTSYSPAIANTRYGFWFTGSTKGRFLYSTCHAAYANTAAIYASRIVYLVASETVTFYCVESGAGSATLYGDATNGEWSFFGGRLIAKD